MGAWRGVVWYGVGCRAMHHLSSASLGSVAASFLNESFSILFDSSICCVYCLKGVLSHMKQLGMRYDILECCICGRGIFSVLTLTTGHCNGGDLENSLNESLA